MNIKDIGNKLFSFLKKGLRFLKEIFKLPYIKTYIIVSIILVILFVIITFPYDIILRNQLQKLELSLFKSIYIRDIQTSIIDVTTMKNIIINIKDDDEIKINDVTFNIAINPYTVFVKKIIKGDLAINGFRYSTKEVQIELNLNGNIDLQMDNKFNTLQNGKMKFIIQNCIIKLNELNIPTPIGNIPVSIPELKLSTINIDSIITNKNLKIENLIILGPDLKGSISGTLSIANIFSNSIMNLTVLIDPQSKIISNYKELLTAYTDKDGKIKLPLKGTISQPKLETIQTPENINKSTFKPDQTIKKSGINRTIREEPTE